MGGDFTGTVLGNLTGNVGGDFCGVLDGDLDGAIGGDFSGKILGRLNGAIGGDLEGDVDGDVVGTVGGNIQGNINGDIAEGADIGGDIGAMSWEMSGGTSAARYAAKCTVLLSERTKSENSQAAKAGRRFRPAFAALQADSVSPSLAYSLSALDSRSS